VLWQDSRTNGSMDKIIARNLAGDTSGAIAIG